MVPRVIAYYFRHAEVSHSDSPWQAGYNDLLSGKMSLKAMS